MQPHHSLARSPRAPTTISSREQQSTLHKQRLRLICLLLQTSSVRNAVALRSNDTLVVSTNETISRYRSTTAARIASVNTGLQSDVEEDKRAKGKGLEVLMSESGYLKVDRNYKAGAMEQQQQSSEKYFGQYYGSVFRLR